MEVKRVDGTVDYHYQIPDVPWHGFTREARRKRRLVREWLAAHLATEVPGSRHFYEVRPHDRPAFWKEF
jgi:hypothetical protein